MKETIIVFHSRDVMKLFADRDQQDYLMGSVQEEVNNMISEMIRNREKHGTFGVVNFFNLGQMFIEVDILQPKRRVFAVFFNKAEILSSDQALDIINNNLK